MLEFKKFVEVTEQKERLIAEILAQLSEDEIDEFGEVLYTEFFSSDSESEESEDYFFGLEDVQQMVSSLGAGMLDDILDLLDEDDELPEEDLDESFSRVMKKSRMNRKTRKFMTKSKAELRKTKAQRKRSNRENKAKRKRTYRANKTKIKAYQKSRSAAIKKGTHKVKLRRKSG